MKELTLKAQIRSVLGKQVKAARKAGTVPGVIFGPDTASTPIEVELKPLMQIWKDAGYSKLIKVKAGDDAAPMLGVFKEVQIHPVSGHITHIAIYKVNSKRELTAEIPLLIVGESDAVKKNLGFLALPKHTIQIRCLPQDLPNNIEIDISILADVGDTITVGDIKLPENVALHSSEDLTDAVAAIQAPQKIVETEEVAEGAEGAEGAAEDAEATSTESE